MSSQIKNKEQDVQAEIIVCRGPPKCDGQTKPPCPYCVHVTVEPDGDPEETMAAIEQALNSPEN